MKEYTIRCPCCGEYITFSISDIGKITNVFFNANNTKPIHCFEFGNLEGGE